MAPCFSKKTWVVSQYLSALHKRIGDHTLKTSLRLHGIDDIEVGQIISFIGLDFSRKCNLRCRYCYEDAGQPSKNELSLTEKIHIIDQAVLLGAHSMLVPGAGEPLLDNDFHPIIEYAHWSGLVSVIFTNGVLINRETAIFMFEHEVTPLVKIESFDPQLHDWITQVPGSYDKACAGLENLRNVGYGFCNEQNGRLTRIGTATLYLKQNIAELPSIQYYYEAKGIKATFDILSISGRACQWEKELKPDINEISKINYMLRADESMCPISDPCRLWQHGIMVGNTGDVSYCTAVHPPIGNIRDSQLYTLIERKNQLYPI
jgi:MoaA/NifB/PqqE/SkfB family radical SAM enzyme